MMVLKYLATKCFLEENNYPNPRPEVFCGHVNVLGVFANCPTSDRQIRATVLSMANDTS